MWQMKPLDPAFTVQQQFAERESGPVVLVNLFTLDPADEAAFMDAWKSDAVFMKARPVFISAQLHRAGPSPAYFNYAVWESLEAFRAAFSDAGFQAS
ncbi:MAG: antibiotic biosynthesis monooxygenase [Sphingomonas sp.]|nr:antibiotic biosynthesis monooxygenase [Sphingomonas sp.]